MKKTVVGFLILSLVLSLFVGTASLALADEDDDARAQAAEDYIREFRRHQKAGTDMETDKEGEDDGYSTESVVVTSSGFEFDTEWGEITGYYGSGGNITIPSRIDGHDVVAIGDFAFIGCYSITGVVIPDSVEYIGHGSFMDCYNMTSVTIPSSVWFIGHQAFAWCESLTSVYIPSSVEYIVGGPFAICPSLTVINVSSSNDYYCSVSGVLYNKDQTELIQYPAGKTGTTYTVASSVTEICSSAFDGCDSLTCVTLPSGLETIDDYAFANCMNLEGISIPNGVSSIGYNAFYFCLSLPSVTIPSSVTSIGEEAFASCMSMTDITVSSSNPSYCSDGGVLFNKAMTTLVQYPAGKGDTGYAVPMGVESIGGGAFEDCYNLENVALPSGVLWIGNYAFWGCDSLSSITIPSGLINIGHEAFFFCQSLERANIPTSVEFIGEYAFEVCHPNLTFYGTLGSYAQSYAGAHGIPFVINFTRSEDIVGGGMLCRTFFNESDDVVCKVYYRGTTDASARIQADYYNMAGTMVFTEVYDTSDKIIASIWFQDDGVTKQFKNYYNNGRLYFQEEYDLTDTIIASIWFQADGFTRHFKNYYSGGVLSFQEEYDEYGDIIASIWFQADGVTRHYKNYYQWYLYFQEEYNTNGTMIASINFRWDGSRERKCYYRVSDGSLYLIEYYDEDGNCFASEWF